MSKSKKKSQMTAQKQLETDIAKFNVVFNSWTDDDKILYNRLHLQDKQQYAANVAIDFTVSEFSFDKEDTIEKYKSYMAKKENERVEAMKKAEEEQVEKIKKESIDKDISEMVKNG